MGQKIHCHLSEQHQDFVSVIFTDSLFKNNALLLDVAMQIAFQSPTRDEGMFCKMQGTAIC